MTLRPWSTITGGARNLYDHWRRVDPDAAAATQLAARRVFSDEPRIARWESLVTVTGLNGAAGSLTVVLDNPSNVVPFEDGPLEIFK